MKSNTMKVFFTAAIVIISLGLQAQESHDGHSHDRGSGNTPIQMVKGMVLDLNCDGSWDFVTFGLTGADAYTVSYVELLSEKEESFGSVDNLFRFPGYGISWFYINLADYKTPEVFYLRVHLVKRWGLSSTSNTLVLRSTGTGDNPNDPEETILIVKYP